MQSTRSSAGPCAGRRGPVRPRASAGVSAPAPAKVQERTAAPMNLVFVSAEVAPWSKTGGLGDVVRPLSRG